MIQPIHLCQSCVKYHTTCLTKVRKKISFSSFKTQVKHRDTFSRASRKSKIKILSTAFRSMVTSTQARLAPGPPNLQSNNVKPKQRRWEGVSLFCPKRVGHLVWNWYSSSGPNKLVTVNLQSRLVNPLPKSVCSPTSGALIHLLKNI